jgi:hypothetical protein
VLAGLLKAGWIRRGLPDATGGDEQRRRQTPEPAAAVCSDLDVRRVAWGCIYRLAVVAKGLVGGSGARLPSLMGGGRRSDYGHWLVPRTGVRSHGESCVPRTDDGDAFGCHILPWKRVSIGSLPFV